MIYIPVFFALCLWLALGVFGVDSDEVKSVSVMEGDSVTQHTNLTHTQTDIQILWTFKLHTRLAEILKREQMNSYFVSRDGIFRDHLQMDNQTGSLTITNIKTEHTGLYKLMIISDKISYTSFTVIVHAHLSVPVISRDSSQCSSSSERSSVSKCVLLCTVMNVTHVSLSWYKGNSLLSSISVSDLNIRLSLPLEVEYQDTNTYRCVVSNPVSNQTQQLDINEICVSCSAHMQNPHLVGITVFLVLVVATAAVAVMWFLYNRNSRHRVQTRDEEEIHYADTTFCARHNEIPKADEHTVYSSVF
ncbi:hypothetical protein E1301_Tti012715 [Triplophysa tibetana]|uniref:Ig-like domain-containing protein n=1 Tax=Triplophysa tibetana TaxID=1572043 RepID=A0A5A9NPD5_9TELE|nr:hypothetical protein E1301_Tti012715 [Triplophysa tibetana]